MTMVGLTIFGEEYKVKFRPCNHCGTRIMSVNEGSPICDTCQAARASLLNLPRNAEKKRDLIAEAMMTAEHREMIRKAAEGKLGKN